VGSDRRPIERASGGTPLVVNPFNDGRHLSETPVEEHTMRAVQLAAYGRPVEVLKFVDLAEPMPPGANQVLLGVEYSPINMSDLLVASGVYPQRLTLPTVIGNEGVGTVLAAGPGVRNVAVGDRVLVPLNGLAWTERLVVAADRLFALPPDADVQQLAMLSINPPTAALLLSEFVELKAGDWVVQNAANSGVGRAVIAFAKRRGLRTVNLVRRPELVRELVALGGDLVVLDTPEDLQRIKAAVGKEPPRLAVDGVGGRATATLSAVVSRGATIVSYSAMSKEPLPINAIDLIFRGIVVRGFWLNDPVQAAKIQPILEEAAEMVRAGQLSVPVAATYPLSAIKDAVAHVQRGGKVLLDVAAAR
jgi:NADPH:quinone reductase-like Zn-dependent oxidoreductase